MGKKIRSNRKGFTLVEVIVVAVIVAVLAAVGIPLYLGYVADSRRNVADNLAGSIASACGATIQQGNAAPAGVAGPNTITFTAGAGGELNRIEVPTGFTVSITGGKVKVTHSSSAACTSKTYTFSGS